MRKLRMLLMFALGGLLSLATTAACTPQQVAEFLARFGINTNDNTNANGNDNVNGNDNTNTNDNDNTNMNGNGNNNGNMNG